MGTVRGLIGMSRDGNRCSMAGACAIAVLLLGSGARAIGAIKQCEADKGCLEPPAASAIISPPKADVWGRRATEALLAEHAREFAKWSTELVVVAANTAARMPRRYRLVANKGAGEEA